MKELQETLNKLGYDVEELEAYGYLDDKMFRLTRLSDKRSVVLSPGLLEFMTPQKLKEMVEVSLG